MSTVAEARRTGESGANWFREEYERAKVRNAQIPPHARMVVTNPALSAHVHKPSSRPALSAGGEG